MWDECRYTIFSAEIKKHFQKISTRVRLLVLVCVSLRSRALLSMKDEARVDENIKAKQQQTREPPLKLCCIAAE